MRRGTVVVPLLGVVMAVGACSGVESQRLVPARRLADERARASGQREAATLQLGEVTRYVLGPAVIPGVTSVLRTSDETGRIDVEVACPPGLAGTPAMASIEIVPFGGAVTAPATAGIRHVQRILECPPPGAAPVVLSVDARSGAGDARVTSVVGALPSSGDEIDVADVPRNAWLRVGIGVRRLGTPPSGAELALSLRAETADGKRVTLWRGRLPVPPGDRPEAWREISVPLEPARVWLGSSLRLVFEGQTVHTPDYDALVAWGDPTIWAPPFDRKALGWNVVIVSLDTLRADRLGVYGYPLAVSPVLDTFAREGTIFERAVTQATWTLPSHATMLTGTYPCVHRAGMAPEQQRVVPRPLPIGIRPLAELLRQAGYVTVAFTEDALVDPVTFQRGFSSFFGDRRGGDTANPPAIEDTVGASVRWMSEHGNEPFFLFLHTYQVHVPYDPPPAYAARIPNPLPLPRGGLPPAERAREDAARYVAEVAYTDASLASLFATLDAFDLTSRTIVLITSDHGEAFGEHRNKLHGYSVFEEEVWVPMIWRAPSLIAAGRRVGGLVGLVDVAPTTLDLLGLPIPAWMQGRSLAAELRPGGPSRVPRNRVLPLSGYVVTGIRGEAWKAIEGPDRYRFLNLARDPKELHAVPGDHAKVEEARRHLAAECATGEALRTPEGDGPALPSFDVERDRKLRALGYVE